MSRIQIFLEVVRKLKTIKPVAKTSPLYEVGNRCFDLAVSWFGPPPDANRKFDIAFGPSNTCFSPKRGTYLIVIHSKYQESNQHLAVLAHEMYHRVTRHYTGLRTSLWVDELLAFLFTHHALREFHESKYADLRAAEAMQQETKLDIREVQALQRTRFSLTHSPYPDGYGRCIAETALQLNRLVSWEQIRTIVKCSTWNEWLSGLPIELHSQIIALLNIEP